MFVICHRAIPGNVSSHNSTGPRSRRQREFKIRRSLKHALPICRDQTSILRIGADGGYEASLIRLYPDAILFRVKPDADPETNLVSRSRFP